jgi:hypothetical protein
MASWSCPLGYTSVLYGFLFCKWPGHGCEVQLVGVNLTELNEGIQCRCLSKDTPIVVSENVLFFLVPKDSPPFPFYYFDFVGSESG